MAGSPIATLFARLGFDVDKTGLKSFEGHLNRLKTDVNQLGASYQGMFASSSKMNKSIIQQGQSFKYVGEQADQATQKTTKRLTTAQKELKRLKRQYKSPLTRGQLESDFKQFHAYQEQYSPKDQIQIEEGLRSETRKFDEQDQKRSTAAAKRTRKAEKLIGSERKSLGKLRESYQEVNKDYKKGLTFLERRERVLSGLRDEYRKLQGGYTNEKHHANLLERVEKTYDKHGKQMQNIRKDYDRLNQMYADGNVSLEKRNRLVRQQMRAYRDAGRAQRRLSSGGRGRVGSAGGIYAGGEDPRQIGNHRFISALHSDTGLGAMIGAMGAAQSVSSYQGYKAMEQGLTGATGSAQQASKEMEYLRDLSQEMGLFMGDLGEDYAKFAASARDTSITIGEQRDIFKGVAAQVRILNLSAADSKRIFRA